MGKYKGVSTSYNMYVPVSGTNHRYTVQKILIENYIKCPH